MSGPRWIDVTTPSVRIRALTWGPDDGPIALCLHGFPDTAYSWRLTAPKLADAGWRVVAPFLRGYVPSSLPSDGSYHVGALMDDALRMLDAAGPTGRDVVIGHDWGAIAATGLAAMPDGPFTRAVIMSVPIAAAFRTGATPRRGRLAAELPAQLARSTYIALFQIPWLSDRSASWVVSLLWRRWSPGYPAGEDIRHVDAAIGTPQRWRAALSYYRTLVRGTRPPAQYAQLHRYWLSPPQIPSLYLHGARDGCFSPSFAQWMDRVLPDGSDVAVIEHGGHFLQLDQADVVARRFLDFLGPAR